MPARYNACHRNASKRPCHLHAALSAILRLTRYLACLACQQETLQAIFFVLTRYPACRLHADKMPCMLFQCQQVYPFQNSLFRYITREMSRYFSKVTRNCAINKIFLKFMSTRIKQKATCVNALLLVRRSFQLKTFYLVVGHPPTCKLYIYFLNYVCVCGWEL